MTERIGDADGNGLERLVFFSDAVVAIAITLLALDLPVPEGDTDAALWRSFRDLLPRQYLTFLLSFVVVAAFWRAHHRFFRHVARIGPGLVGANTLFMFTIVVLPFATRVLGEKNGTRFGTILYALAVVAVGLSLLLLLLIVLRGNLLRPGTPPALRVDMVRGVTVPIAAFLLSIPLAFVNVSLAKYSWLFLSVLAVFALRAYDALRRR
ncbi:MAG TPA: TMEM175 family protein [Rugosimonospora sp.]|nr:TMEM175 family protein [Rugosimonospora sp.]